MAINIETVPKWLAALALVSLFSFAAFLYASEASLCYKEHIRIAKKGESCIDVASSPTPFEELREFDLVIEKATEVISRADKSLHIAVDVPGYGSVSNTKVYSRYKEKLLASMNRNVPIKAMWFPREMELKYVESVEGLTDKGVEKKIQAILDSDEIRRLLNTYNPREVPLQQLTVHNFWVSRDKDNKYRSVMAWITDIKYPASVQGVYTESEDIGKLLVSVWNHWNKQAMGDSMQIWQEIVTDIRNGNPTGK